MKLRCFISLFMMMVAVSTAGAVELYRKNGNTLDVFGGFVGGHYFSEDNKKYGDYSFVKYGILGKTNVNDWITGFGMWECEFSASGSENINAKNNVRVLLGYAGVKFGNFGSIDYGRNYGILYNVASWIDIIPVFGGDICLVDNFLSGRGSNIITYRNENLFGLVNGLDFAVQYQGENEINERTGRTLKTANGEGYGVSVSYALNNEIAASAVYANSKRILEQSRLDDDISGDYMDRKKHNTAEAYSFGVKYAGNGMYAAAIYGVSYNMVPFGNFERIAVTSDSVYGFINKEINFGVSAQYQFDIGLCPSLAYLQSKTNDLNYKHGSYLKKYVTVGVNYLLDKNISTTVDYRINLLDKDGFAKLTKVCTDDIFSLGISYMF